MCVSLCVCVSVCVRVFADILYSITSLLSHVLRLSQLFRVETFVSDNFGNYSFLRTKNITIKDSSKTGVIVFMKK